MLQINIKISAKYCLEVILNFSIIDLLGKKKEKDWYMQFHFDGKEYFSE